MVTDGGAQVDPPVRLSEEHRTRLLAPERSPGRPGAHRRHHAAPPLLGHKVQAVRFRLTGSAARLELLEQTGQSSLPHVFIGGQHVGGLFTSPPAKPGSGGGGGLAALRESGELGRLVAEAQAQAA